MSKLASLISQSTDESLALDLRLKLTIEMRQRILRLDADQVVKMMTAQRFLVVKLAEALLYTAYVPLQQLYYMALVSLLSALNGSNSALASTARHHLRENLKQLNEVLLSALPVDEVVEVLDSGDTTKARKQVNALNRSSKTCRTYIVRKCWISSGEKSKLMPISVDKWLDFGDKMVTFYHQLPRETILYNIPYNCVKKLEFDEARSLAHIFTSNMVKMNGINVVAFRLEHSDFQAFTTTLREVSVGVSGAQATHTTPTQKNRNTVRETTMRLSPTVKGNARPRQKNPVDSRMNSIRAEIAPVAREVSLLAEADKLQLLATTPRSGRTIDTRMQTPHVQTVRVNSLLNEDIPTSTQVREQVVYEDTESPRPSCQSVTLATFERNPHPVRDVAEVEASMGRYNQIASARVWWRRLIQDQVRYFLPKASDRENQPPQLLRSASIDSTADLARAKAECLQNLKESLGYVDERETGYLSFPLWLILVMALLIIVPWTLVGVYFFDNHLQVF